MQPTIMKPLMMGLLFRYDRENTQLEKMFWGREGMETSGWVLSDSTSTWAGKAISESSAQITRERGGFKLFFSPNLSWTPLFTGGGEGGAEGRESCSWSVCLEAWHINSAHAPLNRDDGGLLPDAYLHLARKRAANYWSYERTSCCST